MAERTLRGARLGGQSFEDERGIEFAARQQVGYACPRATGSRSRCPPRPTSRPSGSARAAAPRVSPVDGIKPEEKAEKPVRTHWDMLLERRSVKELEDILTERLELLRGGEIGPAHLHRPRRKTKALTPDPTARSVDHVAPDHAYLVRGDVMSGPARPRRTTTAGTPRAAAGAR